MVITKCERRFKRRQRKRKCGTPNCLWSAHGGAWLLEQLKFSCYFQECFYLWTIEFCWNCSFLALMSFFVLFPISFIFSNNTRKQIYLSRYQKDASISTQLTWEFWFLSASVLEKLAALSLNDHQESLKSSTDYVMSVFNFDQSLLKASQSVDSCSDKNLLKEFLNHYEAQLNLHLSVLAFKQAKRDLITFKEVCLYVDFVFLLIVVDRFRFRILSCPFFLLRTMYRYLIHSLFGSITCRKKGDC